MKKAVVHFLLCLASLPFSMVKAQNIVTVDGSFVLDGIVKGHDTGCVALLYKNNFNGQLIKDTTCLQNGKFTIRGVVSEPTLVLINYPKVNNKINSISVYIEAGWQQILLPENDNESVTMQGSATQKELDTLHMYYNAVEAKYKSIEHQYASANSAFQKAKTETRKNKALEKANKIKNKLDNKQNELANENIKFILPHSDSYISPWILNGLIYSRSISIDSAEVLFNGLTERIKNCNSGKYFTERLPKFKQNSVGDIALDFKAIDFKRDSISLSKFSGKYVLLEFWASWCVPCRKAMPHLKELYNQYHSRGFELVAISIDKDAVEWEKAIASEKIEDWHHVLVNKDIEDKYENEKQFVPTQILIGTDGKIIWKTNSEGTLDEMLGKFIK